MTPRLSGHFLIFGLVFFLLKSSLEIARQSRIREKFGILSQKPRSRVRSLIYRTCKGYCLNGPPDLYSFVDLKGRNSTIVI